MSSPWQIKSETVYPAGSNPFDNRFYGYRSTDLILPDGRPATYHGVTIPDCLHIVAVEKDLTTYLVRQSRPNARALSGTAIPETLELPGGFKKAGIEMAAAANAELSEEIGKRAGSLTLIGSLYPSPGVSNEVDSIYLGTDLTTVDAPVDVEATEQDMRIVAAPFGELYDSIIRGNQPASAQTLAAMAMAATYL